MVPRQVCETKVRNVCTIVPETKEVQVCKTIKVPTTKTVTVMEPCVETKTVMKKKAVCVTEMVDKVVKKKVRVPVVEDCKPAC